MEHATWHGDDIGRRDVAFSPIPKMEMSVSELRGGGVVFKGRRGTAGVARKSLADVVTELIGVSGGGAKALQGEGASESLSPRRKEGKGIESPDVIKGEEGGQPVTAKRMNPPKEDGVVGSSMRAVSRSDAAVVAGGGWRAGADLEIDIHVSRTDSSSSVRENLSGGF